MSLHKERVAGPVSLPGKRGDRGAKKSPHRPPGEKERGRSYPSLLSDPAGFLCFLCMQAASHRAQCGVCTQLWLRRPLLLIHPSLWGCNSCRAFWIRTVARRMESAHSSSLILQPTDKRQAMVRRESVINLENFRKQYARRRWKLAQSIVTLCNHLSRSLMRKAHLVQEESLRNCESDHEEDLATRHRLRRSSSIS
uniref:Uncharacterized protein n=1 Tax=Sphaerodactylus townsendi TaxID=933632 RepID=A0ACB8E4S3_9SAUR